MPKKIKGFPFDSAPHDANQDARARLKHQTLMQDYLELQTEVGETRNKLEAMKQRKLILLAEVRYMRRRYKILMKYRSSIPPQDREFDLTQTVETQRKKKTCNQIYGKKQARLCSASPNFILHQQERLHIGKEASSKKAVALVDGKNAFYTGKDVAPLDLAPVLTVNNKGRMYSEKKAGSQNVSAFDLNKNARLYGRNDFALLQNVDGMLFDLNHKAKVYSEKEDTLQNRVPIIDLNEVSREDEEFQRNAAELSRFGEPKKCLISGGNDKEPRNMKLPNCRNVGEGSTRVGKRKISWQDPVALKV